MRTTIAATLCIFLALPTAALAGRTQDDQLSIQQQVLEIPQGSPVEVRLKTKVKLRGRLGEVITDGFAIQIARGNQTVAQQIAFDDVKSLKKVNAGSNTGTHILAGIGVAFLCLMALSAAIGGG